jgi:trans-AT polyketide synthase/acyltransferase/oxidoreductase domain-containing protein
VAHASSGRRIVYSRALSGHAINEVYTVLNTGGSGQTHTPLGTWRPGAAGRTAPLEAAVRALHAPVVALESEAGPLGGLGGELTLGAAAAQAGGIPALAVLPPGPVETLGARAFCARHGLRYAYCAGAMANGIASEELVEALGNAGLVGFFGAAGLSPARIERAVVRLSQSMAGKPFGCNLINSPNEPAWQESVADLYIKHGVPLIEASAYVSLSLPLIRYRVHGIHRDASGNVVAPNRVIAKLSRTEVAERFFSPPAGKMLAKLVEQGHITAEQAAMAAEIPVAADVTMEADSGGHTDHRPAITALPAMLALRDAMQAKHGYAEPLHVGLGGGVATPWGAAAAFAMGADYIVTGSVNQACAESGTSALVRGMLAEATQTDVGKAPAADMFEMGVTVQVLKKGTRFTLRGAKLYDTYKAYGAIDAIPDEERAKLEKEIFRLPLDEVWAQTHAFFAERDPKQLEKAEKDPRYKMALVFRWYLGQSSGWANRGTEDRREDFQIWCGPAMGAFNEWVAGSFLEPVAARRAVNVAHNILYGAALVARLNLLARQGVALAAGAVPVRPLEDAELEKAMAE